MYIETITPQNTAGSESSRRGPGWMPRLSMTPNNTAVVPEPGMPRVSNGTKEPVQAALLAASGAAMPHAGLRVKRFSKS